ncbi:unnamed protein product [Gongylonema pulchrum]|uniref:DNA-directed RNA polymerase n=1 Tax=Gongylonema pulchrum TaxID=637853 RepID=A0A183EK80_9BILA|nr:unnamed protein product [Gongylonema pulchrum]
MECDIASYHVESFNYLAEQGVQLAALDVPAEKFRLPNGDAVELRYTGAQLGYPSLEIKGATSVIDQLKLFPSECRQRGLTYRGPLKVGIEIRMNGIRTDLCEVIVGEVPIMLRSSRCHLQWLTREQLIAHGEEGNEKGGYFICKGSEKVFFAIGRYIVLFSKLDGCFFFCPAQTAITKVIIMMTIVMIITTMIDILMTKTFVATKKTSSTYEGVL